MMEDKTFRELIVQNAVNKSCLSFKYMYFLFSQDFNSKPIRYLRYYLLRNYIDYKILLVKKL